jgi:DNA-binding PadR family transcriptional regulator
VQACERQPPRCRSEKLEEIGYLSCTKALVGRRPRTTYRISAAGRKALAHYLDQMQALIDAIRGAR